MRTLQMISAYILLIVVIAGCQPAITATPFPEEMEPQTVSPGSTPESPQTQPSNPLLTPEDTDMTSPIPLDENAENMVVLVRAHLAQQLGVPVEQITVAEVKSTIWRDRGLGCPKPAVDYIPMETPGYRIVLEAGGRTYNYHTDEVKRFVACNRP